MAVAIASPLYFISGETEAPSERRHSLSICPRELVNQVFLSTNRLHHGQRGSWAVAGAPGLVMVVRAGKMGRELSSELTLSPCPSLQQESPWK